MGSARGAPPHLRLLPQALLGSCPQMWLSLQLSRQKGIEHHLNWGPRNSDSRILDMLQAMVDQGREGKEAIKAAPSGRLWSVGSSQGLSPQARGASPHTPTPVGYWEHPPVPEDRNSSQEEA